mgnify:CR=1 FL=1
MLCPNTMSASSDRPTRVFLAGGSGVIGRQLVPRLVARGYQVTATTRRADRLPELEALGASAVVCDAFDAEGLRAAVAAAAPDVVVHQLTSIPSRIDPRRVVRDFETTNRLRTEGTRNLLAAAEAAGAGRFIAQSVAFAHRPDGDGLKREEDPLFLDCPPAYRPLVEAVASLERQVATADLEGVVLRYGYFYGPGTIYAPGGTFRADVRRRRLPIVGPGSGVFSFVHIDDAADATVAAITGPPGLYQIVDDDPAPVRDWLPHYAREIGAPPPRRVPTWLARLVVGPYAVLMMTEQRGAANDLAKERLGWRPEHPSWRQSLAT